MLRPNCAGFLKRFNCRQLRTARIRALCGARVLRERSGNREELDVPDAAASAVESETESDKRATFFNSRFILEIH